MKKILIVLILTLASSFAFPQDETLIGGKIESGGFGGPAVKFSSVKGNFATFVGGYGGWLINHSFLIGGGGYGLVNKIEGDESANIFYGFFNGSKIQFGYGGLVLEYIGEHEKLFHYSVSALIGGGGVSYNAFYSSSWFNDNGSNFQSIVFVAEPSLNAEINVAAFFRLDVGIGYRLVTGVDIQGLKNSDLSGPTASLTFKFGKF